MSRMGAGIAAGKVIAVANATMARHVKAANTMPTTRAHCSTAVLFMLLAVLAGCSAPERAADPAPSPDGPKLYVSNETEGTISVIDAAANRLLRTVPVGKRPRGIRTTRDGRTVYVALSGSPIAGPGVDESKLPPPDRSSDGIGVVDAASGRLLRILKSGTDPEQFALSSDERRLFVANEDAGQISVVEVDTGAIVKTIPVGEEPEGVDLSPDGRFVYVTSEGENQVAVVDTTNLERVALVPVGARPRSTAFLPDGSRAYVSAENDAAVYVIDTTTFKTVGRIAVGDNTQRPMGVVAAPDGRAIFVTTGRGRQLHRIGVPDHAISAKVEVGERPWGVAISDDGRTLFTANGPSNDVSIIDAATMTVTAKIMVGERPWGVAYSVQ
jgi:YVTN family beta-propeller protein